MSYLNFTPHDNPKGKTLVYSVWSSVNADDLLGTIKWRSGWRRYVFYPGEMTCFDVACLTEVITFITELMLDRDPSKKYQKTFGDDRVCECDHPYYRHFDTYEQMAPVGCKYCICSHFKEKK